MQIEGAGLVKNAKNPEGAKAFLDFLISKEAQEIIPETQWMYPINNTVELPSCYEVSPVPAKTLTVDQAELEKAVEKVLAILAG
jgi:thiamine transport system substrate-binding protein